eukprot:Phypoly_transcript_03073.p1 GENE.Phypoly_transcript_03073~~Phypoly_transcript_03073.p1  ORF type:complete len:492 (+),score=39.24 Phypoly_transcript_03073:901-2376(+)
MITFDTPPEITNTKRDPFEKRYTILVHTVASDHPFLVLAYRILNTNSVDLDTFLKQIITCFGEGVILRKYASTYENGRSQELFKLKATRGDKEALVVEVNHRHLVLMLADGTPFSVEKSDQLTILPKRGDVVSFSYDSYSRRALPVNPKILCVRLDINWDQVIDLQFPSTTNQPSQQDSNFVTKPARFWQRKNMRAFLENFARRSNFSPLVVNNWYSISRKHIQQTKEGRTILVRYGGSLTRALQDLFPEITFNPILFSCAPRTYWQNTQNRKHFFETFALAHRFEPLVPTNWYCVGTSRIKSNGGASTMNYYRGNLAKALLHIFPDIGFDTLKLNSRQYNHPKNRRKFFDSFALENGFYPHVPDNWYSVTTNSVLSYKAGATVLSYYQGSLRKALFSLYPNIGLDQSKFALPRHYWADKQNQRNFFVQFAFERALDPLLPETWYPVKVRPLVDSKGSATLLHQYKGSFVKALVDLFPDITFDVSKFQYCS